MKICVMYYTRFTDYNDNYRIYGNYERIYYMYFVFVNLRQVKELRLYLDLYLPMFYA